jgi:hypothetical protein
MFRIFTFYLLSFTYLSFGQSNITVDNYYSHYKDHDDILKLGVKEIGTVRLSELEIAKVLREEMKLAGFEWLMDNQMIRVDNEKYLTSICYSRKSKFGFVLETSFSAIPDKKNREVKSLSREYGYDYAEQILKLNGDSKVVKFEELPENLYIIKRDLYWWQVTESEEVNKTLVTKEIAIEILRSDVKNILKKIKK